MRKVWLPLISMGLSLIALTANYRNARSIELNGALDSLQDGLIATTYRNLEHIQRSLDKATAEIAGLRSNVQNMGEEVAFDLGAALDDMEREIERIADMAQKAAQTASVAVTAANDTHDTDLLSEGLREALTRSEVAMAELAELRLELSPPKTEGLVPLYSASGHFMATGWILRPGILVTAAHVDDADAFRLDGNFIKVTDYKALPQPELSLDVVADMAVYRFDPAAYAGPYPDLDFEAPPEGSIIWFTTELPFVGSRDLFSPARFIGLRLPYGDYVTAGVSHPGFSGSPVFYRGKVIGILTAGFSGAFDDVGMWTLVTPINRITELLE